MPGIMTDIEKDSRKANPQQRRKPEMNFPVLLRYTMGQTVGTAINRILHITAIVTITILIILAL
jgi:hypothetical protein